MATRRKRNLNFLPAETRTEPVIDISAYPVDIGVGELMRLTRERLGHELQTVANQLRIRLSYLEAIEDARFRDLPGTTYAVGFVRSYADYLGLDGADIVRRFREEAARIHGQTKLVFPALTAEGKLPRAAVLLVSAIGLAGVYGVWYYISSRQHSDVPVITEVPDRLVALTPDESGLDGGRLDTPATVPAPVETPATSAAPATTPVVEPQTPSGTVDSGPGAANAATAHESASIAPAAPTGAATDLSTAPPAAPVATAPAESAPVATAPTDSVPTTEAAGSPASTTPSPSAPAAETGLQAAAEPTASDTAPSSDSAPADVMAPAEEADESAAESPVELAPPAVPPAAAEADDIPAAPTLPAMTSPDATQQAMATPPAAAVGGVVLEAHMDSWIKVVDANNKTVINKVLKAGERYEVPDQPGLVLRTGNAGGLDVTVGGQKAPPLGEVGAVYTKILLEPSRLLDGTAVAD
jgi:cytoskeleton protein RodZ